MTGVASSHSVAHQTFTVERTYRSPISQVFAAWSPKQAKAAWFATDGGGWRQTRYDLDFCVGGTEHASAVPPGGGEAHVYDARFSTSSTITGSSTPT
mgnify:CR=1 FL=1